MEHQRRIFLFEDKDDLAAPEIHPLGHARQEIRHTSIHQRLDLFRQDFLQQNTVGSALIVLPGKTFRPMAGKCTHPCLAKARFPCCERGGTAYLRSRQAQLEPG